MTIRTLLAVAAALAAAAALPAVASAARLPVISIEPERDIGDEGVPAHVRAPGYAGPASIKLRGSFSRTLPKKPYALELRDARGKNADAPLLGMPADDDWVLYAAYNDRTLMRNALAYEVSRSIGRYAPRTRFVELRVHGATRGVYVLTEKLELHPRRVPGGAAAFLMEMTSPRQARREDVAFRTPLLARPFVFKDGAEDRLPAIRGAFARAERAIVRGGAGAWRRHLHGARAVDHLLLTELFKNQDGMHASTYVHAPRPSAPLRLGPLWDFDIAMGARGWIRGAHVPTGWMLEQRAWARPLYRDPVFRAAMQRRWQGLRRAGLRARVLRIVDRNRRRLAGAPVRLDLGRWPAGAPHRPGGTFATHVRALERWLVRRFAWMDGRLGTAGAAVAVAAKVINGTEGADRLRGTARADVIRGRGGRDVIDGRGGADRISGGAKDDRIAGGGGGDRIDGGTGEDVMSGGAGADRISGASGKDIVDGGAGNDRIAGGTGGDRIAGGAGRDVIDGGKDNDTILVRDGRRDVVRCSTGKDDFVVADRVDSVSSDCETVSRD